jgi:hypothetical protein
MSAHVEGTHRHKIDGMTYSYRVSYTVYPEGPDHRGAITLLGFVRRAGKEWPMSTRILDSGPDLPVRAPAIVCHAIDAHIDETVFDRD